MQLAPIAQSHKDPQKAANYKMSDAVTNALHHVKEFMTDSQKAHTMLKEGKILMESGNFQGAVECFNEGINFQPIVPLFTNRATCHKQWLMYSEAYFDYSFAIRMEPENGALYCLRGVVLAKMKKIAMAQEDLDLGCKMEPTAPNLFCRATVHYDIGNFESAIKDMTRAIAEEQCTLELRLRCLYRRAAAYCDVGKFNECINDLREVLKGDPNSVPPRLLLGNALKMTSDLKAAEENVAHAVILDPKNPSVYMERGDIRYRTSVVNKIIESIYDFDAAIRLLEEKEKAHKASSEKLQPATGTGVASGGSLIGPGGGSGSPGSSPGKKSFMGGPKPHHRHTTMGSDHSVSGGGSVSGDSVSTSSKSRHSVMTGGRMKSDGSDAGSFMGGGRSNMKNAANKDNVLVNLAKAEMMAEAQSAQERRDQLADALFRRAQAKLLLHQQQNRDDEVMILEALRDSEKATELCPSDDDFLLVAVVALIRLGRMPEAKVILDRILERSPNNEKALFHTAFVNRQGGRMKDAISSLSKIIAYHDANSNKATPFPISRIYETRGTLFHQLQSHTYALSDFGRSVALNPDRAQNYFLRADCHSKLGNYELAISDFNLAESKGFTDKVSLWMARGTLFRVLGDGVSASTDFDRALHRHQQVQGDATLAIRIQMMRSLCLIDSGKFEDAYQILLIALGHLTTGNLAFEPINFIERVASLDLGGMNSGSFHGSTDSQDTLSGRINDFSLNFGVRPGAASRMPIGGSGSASKAGNNFASKLRSSAKAGASFSEHNSQEEEEIMKQKHKYTPTANLSENLKLKLEWNLRYHISLCLHMMHDYGGAVESLILCTSDLAHHCADMNSYGLSLFFLGVCHNVLQNWEEAAHAFTTCLQTSWAASSAHNMSLIHFARGKLFQCQGKHEEAIDEFSRAIEEEPSNAHAMFRRAWSYKALEEYELAGDDFETSKRMKPSDPNFAIDYKKIGQFEYMEIETEPDLVEPFPPLLPLPSTM